MHATMRMVQRLLGKSRIHNARGSGRHDDIFICHVRQPSISTMHVERGRRISWQPTGVSEASPPYRLMWINSLPPSRICSPPPPPKTDSFSPLRAWLQHPRTSWHRPWPPERAVGTVIIQSLKAPLHPRCRISPMLLTPPPQNTHLRWRLCLCLLLWRLQVLLCLGAQQRLHLGLQHCAHRSTLGPPGRRGGEKGGSTSASNTRGGNRGGERPK